VPDRVIVKQYELAKSVMGLRRAQYLQVFTFFFSNHNILRRSQLVYACEQSPKELTVAKETEGRRQLVMFGSRNGRAKCKYFGLYLLTLLPAQARYTDKQRTDRQTDGKRSQS